MEIIFLSLFFGWWAIGYVKFLDFIDYNYILSFKTAIFSVFCGPVAILHYVLCLLEEVFDSIWR